MMKIKIIAFCLCIIFMACKDNNQNQQKNDSEKVSSQNNNYANNDENTSNNSGSYDSTRAEVTPGPATDSSQVNNTSFNPGKYIKTEHLEDSDCSCYCIDINLSAGSELCLKENELYINSRYSKSGNNINIYYTGKSSKTSNSELPWDEFETNTPIAVLSPTSDGNFKLDWKGFSIDGDIAIDYAIYGKKTLEGTYKKQ